MTIKSEWIDLNITSPITSSDLLGLNAVISPVVSFLDTTLTATKGLLEASKLFLIDDFSPAAALQAALSAELNTLIGSLQTTGLGLTFISPELSNLRSLNDNLDLLANSVLDSFDKNRPITSGTSSHISLMVITARSDSDRLLIELWNKIIDLIFNYDKFELESLKQLGQPYENTAIGFTQLPDWQSLQLPEAVPFVGDILSVLRQITESLIDISTVQTDLIDTSIQLLTDKITEINAIQALLDQLILQLEGVESLGGSGLDILYIDGNVTERELYSAINAAKASLPDNTGTDVSALCAFYATSPEVGSTLKNIFTGSN